MIQQQQKSFKFPKFFIIIFPKGEQVLVKSKKSWAGLIPYIKYLKDEFEDNYLFIPIRRWEAIKFILKGYVFDVDK